MRVKLQWKLWRIHCPYFVAVLNPTTLLFSAWCRSKLLCCWLFLSHSYQRYSVQSVAWGATLTKLQSPEIKYLENMHVYCWNSTNCLFLHIHTWHKTFKNLISNVFFVYVILASNLENSECITSKIIFHNNVQYLLHFGAPNVITKYTWFIIL